MPVLVVDQRLKDFDEWFKLFKSNPPKVGHWRVLRGSEDRNRVQVVAVLAVSEVKDVKDFIQSKDMQDVFKQVNDMYGTDGIHLARRVNQHGQDNLCTIGRCARRMVTQVFVLP